jgi:hypothetical protein
MYRNTSAENNRREDIPGADNVQILDYGSPQSSQADRRSALI